MIKIWSTQEQEIDRPSCKYYRQMYCVHSELQDESLQVTISKLL